MTSIDNRFTTNSPRKRAPNRAVYGKTKISNGSEVLPNVDGRSLVARRYGEILSALLIDQGDAGKISEARLQYIRRFAAAAVLAEQIEAALARGETIDIGDHALLCSTMVRVGNKIGLDRISKDVTPTVRDYLALKQAEAV
jgi:hypothetical protein